MLIYGKCAPKYSRRDSSSVNIVIRSNYFSGLINCCYKSVFVSMPGNSPNPGGAVTSNAMPIPCVLNLFNVPKIIYLVIGCVAVNVVNIVFRPFFINIEPSEPMRVVPFPVNTDLLVPLAVGCTSSAARFNRFIQALNPNKYSGVGVVIKSFAEHLMRKIIIFHGGNYSMNGGLQ